MSRGDDEDRPDPLVFENSNGGFCLYSNTLDGHVGEGVAADRGFLRCASSCQQSSRDGWTGLAVQALHLGLAFLRPIRAAG